jgi:hypothetical protein
MGTSCTLTAELHFESLWLVAGSKQARQGFHTSLGCRRHLTSPDGDSDLLIAGNAVIN